MTSPGPVDYLTLEDLLDVAAGVVGGQVEVHDVGLLAGAAARPRATAFGQDASPTFAEKAAALLHTLARSHALVGGNKRLAWAATRVFCLLNGTDLCKTVDQAEALMLAVASGDLNVPDLPSLLSPAPHVRHAAELHRVVSR